MIHFPKHIIWLALCAALAACGGGSGGSAASGNDSGTGGSTGGSTGGTTGGGTGGTTGGTTGGDTGGSTGGTTGGGTGGSTGGTTGGSTSPSSPASLSLRGVSLAGAEFGEGNLPGTYGTHYIYPTVASVDYYRAKGMNMVRLPFRWERLQPTLGQSFDATELGRLTTFVNGATATGMTVLLDPHNYARWKGQLIGSGSVTNAHFADFWTRLAQQFKGNDKVAFGLMNEPHSMPTEQWLAAANAALAAIRTAGATNLVTVPGNAWTGAHSWSQNWYGTPNATVMKDIVDPGHNMLFEVHQYLDGDSSGTSDQCVSATIGSERLRDFTAWLRANGHRALLGEFAGGANATCNAAVTDTLAHLDANADVWAGWTWWAAGPWWGSYMYSLEPANGADKPQMAVLAPHLAAAPLQTSGNPYAGALMYVDPDYVAAADGSLAKVAAGSADATRIAAAKRFPTAVWLDRLAAIDGAKASGGAMGLADHLDAALAQQAAASGSGATRPMVVTIVVYDLPDRDCAALASNGELSSANGGLATYRTQYIDRIAEILGRPAYAGLRIAAVVEPDSYPNMVTNLSKPACAAVNQGNVYRDGIRYAIAKLSPLPNVALYLDIAHSGWLGWDNNRSGAVQAYHDLVAGATPSGRLDVIRGFATNTANYTPLDEPFFDGTDQNVRADGTTQFYEWNRMVDELSYVDRLRADLVARGFPGSIGFIVDTGRNGWGGAGRPTAAAADVDDMRIDRRAHRGNWCNVRNAGIGERPRAAPDASRSHLHAYVFIKPPGASDGTSDSSATTPNDEGKRFDPMCGSGNVDALQGAPHAGHWFHDQFLMLLRNAQPALN